MYNMWNCKQDDSGWPVRSVPLLRPNVTLVRECARGKSPWRCDGKNGCRVVVGGSLVAERVAERVAELVTKRIRGGGRIVKPLQAATSSYRLLAACMIGSRGVVATASRGWTCPWNKKSRRA